MNFIKLDLVQIPYYQMKFSMYTIQGRITIYGTYKRNKKDAAPMGQHLSGFKV